jgi:hypothetical protein
MAALRAGQSKTRKEAKMKRKVKLLPESDVREVVRFQEHLRDMHTMGRAEFGHKYQEYMGLSDAELTAWLASPAQPNGN